MTKRELLLLLATLPDTAEIAIQVEYNLNHRMAEVAKADVVTSRGRTFLFLQGGDLI